MGVLDDVVPVPRRTMVLFFIVDTSGSMDGEKIASLNVAVREVLPYIDDISASNPDAQIKVAVMEFSSGCEWLYPQPMDASDFVWRDLEPGGLTSLGEALKELNGKLSKKEFMQSATGSYAPAFILLSDGEPTDDYKFELEKLKGNPWFKAGIKTAIAIGDDANKDVLTEFVGTSEGVFTVHNKEHLKKIIRFVSITSSQVASKSSSVGVDAPDTKQEELLGKLKETVETSPEFEGVDVGNQSSGTPDEWGEAAGW